MDEESSSTAAALVSCSERSSTGKRQRQMNSSGDSSLEGAEMTDQSSSERGSSASCHTAGYDDEKDPQSREVRKMLRVMANRRSARESRDRRKRLVEDLQEKVTTLADTNAKIAESNLAMRRELVSLLQEAGLVSSLL